MHLLACSGSGCGSSSEATSLGLAGVALAGLVLLVLAVRRIRQARRRKDPLLAVVASILLGLAAFLIVVFGSGLRTYDGSAGGQHYSCAPWWEEAAAPSSTPGVEGDTGPCRQRAIDAVGPALAVSAFTGLVVGAAAGGALALHRRRVRR